MNAFLVYFLKPGFVAVIALFFLIDPFAAIPAFLVMTDGAGAAQRKRMAWRAGMTCFIVLTTFALAGGWIFKIFGITLPAFKIAGGIILVLIGLDMLQARRSATQETPSETAEGTEKGDVGIIPLGIPMLAGPGAISAVMVLAGNAHTWFEIVPILAAVALIALFSYWILAGADSIRHYLGETGIHILTRLFGLILTAIAVQFVVNGLADLGVVKQQ